MSQKIEYSMCFAFVTVHVCRFHFESKMAEMMTCAICLDDMETNTEITGTGGACCHTFHQCCMRNWLVRKPTCPTCRVHVMNQVYCDLHIDYPTSDTVVSDSPLTAFLNSLPRLNLPMTHVTGSTLLLHR